MRISLTCVTLPSKSLMGTTRTLGDWGCEEEAEVPTGVATAAGGEGDLCFEADLRPISLINVSWPISSIDKGSGELTTSIALASSLAPLSFVTDPWVCVVDPSSKVTRRLCLLVDSKLLLMEAISVVSSEAMLFVLWYSALLFRLVYDFFPECLFDRNASSHYECKPHSQALKWMKRMFTS